MSLNRNKVFFVYEVICGIQKNFVEGMWTVKCIDMGMYAQRQFKGSSYAVIKFIYILINLINYLKY